MSTYSRRGLKKPEPSSERTVSRLRLSKAVTLSETTSVQIAARTMAEHRVDAVLLVDTEGILSGILTDKDVAIRLVAEGLDPDHVAASEVMTHGPSYCYKTQSAIEALNIMITGHFRHLPVVDAELGCAVNLLDITKCLYDAITRLERASDQGIAFYESLASADQYSEPSGPSASILSTIRERLFQPAIAVMIDERAGAPQVHPHHTVRHACRVMRGRHSSSVVVVSAELGPGGGAMKGILTSKDVLFRVAARGLSPDHVTVDEVMTRNPDTVTSSATIVDALHMMHDEHYLHLPVVNASGRCVALVDVLQL
eukprot:CAMPEP_0182874228 /NCGR_PEP_ID=MMETSP0034_2-20130328/12812_1 /TAXON_ID=156128 /ORGANISM="Nephroselmis pyriformis, Strain CCMP717" /LENGTH=311 /DNA_ID=CAMNT_0025006931 /DNA_START=144 /DNA_END=1076 /DNA_ORIENTATION=-